MIRTEPHHIKGFTSNGLFTPSESGSDSGKDQRKIKKINKYEFL